MAFHEPFNSIVTLTKRNHRYYGPTESKKIKGELSEISTDLIAIYNEISTIEDSVIALASGFLMPSEDYSSLYDLKRLAYKYEDKLKMQIYTQAYQAEVLE